MSAKITISGLKDLRKTLDSLPPEARKSLWSGMQQGGTVILRSIRSRVPASYKSLKKALDKRFRKGSKSKPLVAKIGAGVGKRQPKPERPKGRGVGITKDNVHWALLGTLKRFTRRGRKPRGAMPPILADIVAEGFAASEEAAMQKIEAVVAQKLAAKGVK